MEIDFHIFFFTCNITWIFCNDCCCSVTQSCLTVCDSMDCSMPVFPALHYLPEVAQTHVHWVSDAIQSSRPLSKLLLLPSIFPSIRAFLNESTLHIRWRKSWSFSFSISPSNEYSGLISFRIDWLDLFAVQGTLKSLLQHLNSKASILASKGLSLLYGPTHTSVHNYWKNHSFNLTDLCQQGDISAF